MSNSLEGEIWLADSSRGPLALEQVNLLQAINETGSITGASRKLGISYKTAWERLDRLNNLARSPLVHRSTGGSQGGGTTLTPYGKRILEGYSQLKQEHSVFVSSLSQRLGSFDELADFVRTSNVVTSARNQFIGEVEQVSAGAVNAEVILKISDILKLVAVITEQSRLDMAVQPGRSLLALVKASSVLLARGETLRTSARNQFTGVISRLELGAVSADVTVDLGSGKTISAIVTRSSALQMGLVEGQSVNALFKASSVILIGL